tara:strand:+ start:369 stop:602 length:234 start_codon:yes stop_codon:yes gene_type:complete
MSHVDEAFARVTVEESNLQQIYRERALERIKELAFILSVAEQDNLNDITQHMVTIESIATLLNRDLSVLSVLKCHRL